MSRILVLSGGSAKISYQIGVLESMQNRKFDVFSGVSCGAILSVMLAMNKFVIARDIVLSLQNKDIYKGSLSKLSVIYKVATGKESIVDMSPLREFLAKYVKKEDFVLPAYISYVDLETGRFVTVCSDDLGTEEIIDAVMASCAIPAIMPAVKINGRKCVDGGLKKVSPLSVAIDLGATEIVVVNCFNREKVTIAPINSIVNIAIHAANNVMLEEMSRQSVNTFLNYNEILEEKGEFVNKVGKRYRYIPITIHEPREDDDLGNSFDFSQGEAIRRFLIGMDAK